MVAIEVTSQEREFRRHFFKKYDSHKTIEAHLGIDKDFHLMKLVQVELSNVDSLIQLIKEKINKREKMEIFYVQVWLPKGHTAKYK